MESAEPANKDRILISCLRDIAASRQLRFETFSHDWIIRLSDENRSRHVYGYTFELNSATAARVAGDKSAVSDLLASRDIPHVAHRLFLHPRLGGYVQTDGNWCDAMAYAHEHDYDVVCKPNEGTSGRNVLRVSCQRELEDAIQTLLEHNLSLAISPFYEITHEYRVILLDSDILLSYAKTPPTVVGNGHSTAFELIVSAAATGALKPAAAARALATVDIAEVPEDGRTVQVGWKHNLGQGATPTPIRQAERESIYELACRAAQALGIRCAAIDLISTQGHVLVLEVNGGIMLEHYGRVADDGAATARRTYERIVSAMFD